MRRDLRYVCVAQLEHSNKKRWSYNTGALHRMRVRRPSSPDIVIAWLILWLNMYGCTVVESSISSLSTSPCRSQERRHRLSSHRFQWHRVGSFASRRETRPDHFLFRCRPQNDEGVPRHTLTQSSIVVMQAVARAPVPVNSIPLVRRWPSTILINTMALLQFEWCAACSCCNWHCGKEACHRANDLIAS